MMCEIIIFYFQKDYSLASPSRVQITHETSSNRNVQSISHTSHLSNTPFNGMIQCYDIYWQEQ